MKKREMLEFLTHQMVIFATLAEHPACLSAT